MARVALVTCACALLSDTAHAFSSARPPLFPKFMGAAATRTGSGGGPSATRLLASPAGISPKARAPPEEDLYATLGVRRDASDAVIKAAYKTAAKTLHPDIRQAGDDDGSGDEDGVRWERMTTAYRTLSHESSRARYDRALAAAQLTEGVSALADAGVGVTANVVVPLLNETFKWASREGLPFLQGLGEIGATTVSALSDTGGDAGSAYAAAGRAATSVRQRDLQRRTVEVRATKSDKSSSNDHCTGGGRRSSRRLVCRPRRGSARAAPATSSTRAPTP